MKITMMLRTRLLQTERIIWNIFVPYENVCCVSVAEELYEY